MIRIRRHIAAWLALLSMLMIIAAPAISQSLSATRALSPEAVVAAADYCGDSSRAAHDTEHHELAACDYCILFAQSPCLTSFMPVMYMRACFARSPLTPYIAHRPASTAVFPNARTRAPPAAV